MESFDAVVIGGGGNGLVAAGALQRAGMRVLLVEAHDTLGGLACVTEFAPGFRCDWFGGEAGWVPPRVSRGLGLTGTERTSNPLTVVLEPGVHLTLPPNAGEAAGSINPFSPADAAAWPAFARRLHALAWFLEALYAAPAPAIDATGLGELWPMVSLGRRFRGLGRDGMIDLLRTLPMSVRQLAEESLSFEPLQAAVAARGVRDSRLGPHAGGTGFLLLHGLVGAQPGAMGGAGVWRAGPDAFCAAAERAARVGGVTIRTGARVARIAVDDYAVTGVVLENGEEIRSVRVLSSADPAHTLIRLVDPIWLDPDFLLGIRNIRFRGCTGAVLYAMAALPDIPGADASVLLRGGVSLGASLDALERAADDVKYGRVADEPHIEITAPSLHWPHLAPAGHHIVAARVQYAPHALPGAGWDDARKAALADRVTAAIDAVIPCFSSRVLHRAVLTPHDIERRWGLTDGAITHGEMMLDQILFMRPLAGWSRYAMPIDGLWLCGAGTHPGPGIAGGSGWLAARRVIHDHGNPGRRNAP
ncbi:MAG: NAD(P)/FAD-dependent oxidoreductase [Gemmatimonadetes bacterium]|nr:NAD(P)/FAD-dependent oxidoreductase [Gemmatimonadota bacterium]